MDSYLFSIAGNIAAGKSTLTKALEHRSDGRIVSFLERVDYVKQHGYLQKYYAAVNAYDRIRDALAAYRLQIRAGIHVGDIDLRDDDISGLTVTAAARIMELADAGQLLVSLPVVVALLGSPASFRERGEVALKGLPGDWLIFERKTTIPSNL